MSKTLRIILSLSTGAVLVMAVYFGWTLLFTGSDTIDIVKPAKAYQSIVQVLQEDRLKGKVVYGDIWGTSCIPCMEEFKNHTQPLKERYKANQQVAFLYLCVDSHPGAEYRWKKRIKDYNIAGHHVLLTEEQFTKFYQQVAGRSSSVQYIPRYFIADRKGNLVVRDAKRPSANQGLYAQLDSTLTLQ